MNLAEILSVANTGTRNGSEKPINGGEMSRSELSGEDGGVTPFARR